MRRLFRSHTFRALGAVLLVSLTSANAWASCPDVFGPYQSSQGPYYQYDILPSCYTLSGGVTRATFICADPGFNFGSGTGQATMNFTVTSSDPIEDPTRWFIATRLKLSSPGGTSSDRFELDVNVTHPNNTVSYYTNYYWSGVNAPLNCYTTGSNFTANVGDNIQIVFTGVNSGTATILAEAAVLTNDSF